MLRLQKRAYSTYSAYSKTWQKCLSLSVSWACQACYTPVLSSKELSNILSCFRDNVSKKFDLYSSSRGATYGNICSEVSISAGWFI